MDFADIVNNLHRNNP